MKDDFEPLSYVPLRSGTSYGPAKLPRLVTLESPALDVMTDFNFVNPVTVKPDVPIDDALEIMKTAGVRLLLVTNASEEIIGLITAKDIQGERPIELVEELRARRSDIHIKMIMTLQSNIFVLNLVSVRHAQVGHIVATLNQLERQHVLVVEVDEDTREQRVCGLFSTSQISKQLRDKVIEDKVPAYNVVEMLLSGREHN
jgi:CBS-domain-containing membrane protein